MQTLEYTRTYSYFEPTFTYNVRDLTTGEAIGAVARNPGQRRWYASNKDWNGGGDFVQTFPTRYAAAVALRFVADGHPVETYGGYAA